MTSVKNYKVKGIVAAVFTPFDKESELKLQVIPEYVSFLRRNGVGSVFVNGTTGESLSLTQQERKDVVAEWAKCKDRLDNLIVHVGAANLKDSIDLAKHASGLPEVDAISTMPSTFFKPPNIESLLSYCQQVAAAAPNLPFYYYHLPSMTGVDFDMVEFMKQARELIPTLVGIKFSLADLQIADTIQSMGFNVLFGHDQELLGAMSHGIDGVIGSTYNILGSVNVRIMKAVDGGDLDTARAEQRRAAQAMAVMFSYGTAHLCSMKTVMTLRGLDLGPTRCPVPNLLKSEATDMQQRLMDIGYFEWSEL